MHAWYMVVAPDNKTTKQHPCSYLLVSMLAELFDVGVRPTAPEIVTETKHEPLDKTRFFVEYRSAPPLYLIEGCGQLYSIESVCRQGNERC